MIPRDRVGIVLGRDLGGRCLGVVVNSTELGTNASRNLAYEVGKAIGSVLSEEEDGPWNSRLLMAFKGKQTLTSNLGITTITNAWREVYREFFVDNAPPLHTRSYEWADVPSIANDMASFIQEYINREPEPVQEVRERDPRLPDHVFESARVPI